MTMTTTITTERAATNAASQTEQAAHNALIIAENAYARAAGLDGNDRREWDKAVRRFARTNAGKQLHATLTEVRKVLREAVRVDTEACKATWVNGFGTIPTPVIAQTEPVTPTTDTAPTEELARLFNASASREEGALFAYYELEADVLSAYPAVETMATYYAAQDTAQAQAMDDGELNMLVESINAYPDAEVDTAVWPTKEAIFAEHARRQVAQNDLNHVLDRASEPAQTDIVTRLFTEANTLTAQSRTTQTEDSYLSVMLDAADAIRALREQLAGAVADLRACERARTATDEAFAGHNEAYAAQVAQLEADKERATTYRASVSSITHDLMGVDLNDTQAVGNLINALWRL